MHAAFGRGEEELAFFGFDDRARFFVDELLDELPEAREDISAVVGPERFAPWLIRSITDVPTHFAFLRAAAAAAKAFRAAICFALGGLVMVRFFFTLRVKFSPAVTSPLRIFACPRFVFGFAVR